MTTSHPLAGRQVLIVEDELIIAWQLQALVESFGCVVSGPAPSVDAALALLRKVKPDAALLDVKLKGERVTPVALECQRQGVPFALVTAYARFRLEDPLLDAAPRVRKPFSANDLSKTLANLLGPSPDFSD